MSGLAHREEMHKMIDSVEDSRLEVVVNKWREDLKIVGKRPDGTPISLRDLKDNIQQSRIEIANGDFTDIDDFEKESEAW